MSVKTIVMMVAVCVFALEAWAQEGAQLPIVHETLKAALRTRIGYRGLYVTSLTGLPNGDLLACPHYGSTDLQRVSIWRSSDEGKTWELVETQGDTLFGAGALLKCLKDGTVLLHTGALYRSTDAGVTWQHIDCKETGIIRSLIEQPDSSLLMFGSEPSWFLGYEPPPRSLLGITYDKIEVPVMKYGIPIDNPGMWYRETSYDLKARRTAWRLCSRDGGQTWPEHEGIINEHRDASNWQGGGWEDPQPFFKEASILPLTDTHFLAATRLSGRGERIVLMESEDAGLNWSGPRDFLALDEIHAQLLLLDDGRLLCTYARYRLPRGIFAVLSEDQGKTWDTDHPICLVRSLATFFGWPTSLQMPDGAILTAYTIKAYEETTQVKDSVTEAVRWELPLPSEGYSGE